MAGMWARRRAAVALATVCAGGLLAGCASPGSSAPEPAVSIDGVVVPAAAPTPVPGGQSAAVVESATYRASVGESAAAERVAQIAEVVNRLRADSTSGWQAVQGDATGWASRLSGGHITIPGSPAAAAAAMMDRYGSAFGPGARVVFDPAEYDAQGVALVRGTQVVGTTPVEGAAMVVTVHRADGGAQVSGMAGSLRDVTGVASAAAITGTQAVDTVRAALKATVSGEPRLVVYTDGAAPALAWAVAVTSADSGAAVSSLLEYPAVVYVDAGTGAIIGARDGAQSKSAQPRTAGEQLGYYDFTLPQRSTPVQIRATLPDGRVVTVNAEELPNGSIAMVDATGPGANRRTKKGVVALFDGQKVDEQTGKLGPVLTYRRAADIPTDAIAAMWGVEQVLAYYRDEMGRSGFDGQNSPLPVVINYTQGQECLDNAFFATSPGASQMFIGVPCSYGGVPSARTLADLSIVGHEITHGVTHTNALTFASVNPWQGAVDEGTSDYFGVVVENKATGEPNTSGMHFACFDLVNDIFCPQQPDGQVGDRPVDSGATLADGVYSVVSPLGGEYILQIDDGHRNAMVWTNALWSARKAVAALDGGDMLNSPRAKQFDQAVHRATTTALHADQGIVDVAEAVQRATAEVGMGPEEQNLVADAFRANLMCRGCLPAAVPPIPVASSTKVKVRPQIAGAQVVYEEFDSRLAGSAMVTEPGSNVGTPVPGGATVTTGLGARGTWVAQAIVDFANAQGGEEVRLTNLTTGRVQTVAASADVSVAPSVSKKGVAWADLYGYVHFRPLTGGKDASIPTYDRVSHVATDGDRVAFQTQDGRLGVWTVSSNEVVDLPAVGRSRRGEMYIASGGLSMRGSRVAVIAEPFGIGPVYVYDLASNTKTTVTDNAAPFGVSIDDRMVVWSESMGDAAGKINQRLSQSIRVPDTQIRGRSLATGQYYRIADERGQQGYPVVSGGLVAWQESANGSSDIAAARLPEGS